MIWSFESDKVIEGLEKGLGKGGDLTIKVICTKCTALFDLNKESVVVAVGTGATFIEYLRWIQSSRCPFCRDKEEK